MTNATDKKPIWQSRSIVTAVMGAVFGILQYFGVFIDPEIMTLATSDETIDSIVATEKASGLFTTGLSILYAYFRIRARKVLSGSTDEIKDTLAKPISWIKGLFKKKS